MGSPRRCCDRAPRPGLGLQQSFRLFEREGVPYLLRNHPERSLPSEKGTLPAGEQAPPSAVLVGTNSDVSMLLCARALRSQGMGARARTFPVSRRLQRASVLERKLSQVKGPLAAGRAPPSPHCGDAPLLHASLRNGERHSSRCHRHTWNPRDCQRSTFCIRWRACANSRSGARKPMGGGTATLVSIGFPSVCSSCIS